MIQGQQGSFKSGFSQLFGSVLLKLPHCENRLLGFEANKETSYTVIYVDTERNLTEQFPHGLQQIQMNAGYYLTDEPDNFDFISLLDIKRAERFTALTEYLEKVRTERDNHLFIILDVVTDCIEDFNNTKESLKLTDMLNMAINKYNLTFLCVIHENPNSNNKARGHIGTELMNKSSTVMQVGFEKNSDGSDSNIIRLKFLKCRSTERHEPIHVVFDKATKQLVEADSNEVKSVFEKRKTKAVLEDVIDYLEQAVTFPIPKKELLDDLMAWLNTSDKTINERLDTIINEGKVVYKDGKAHLLFKDEKKGRNVMFNIKPIETND